MTTQAEADASTTQPPSHPPPRWVWARRALYALLVVIVVFSGLLSWALGSQSGRKNSLHFALDQLNSSNIGLEIHTSGVRSPALGEWYFEQLRVTQQGRPWVAAEQLHIKAQLKPLLKKHVLINLIRSQRLEYNHHSPDKQAEESSQSEPASFDWQLELQELSVEELALSMPEVDAIPVFKVNGSLAAFTPRSPLDISFTAQSLGDDRPQMLLELSSQLISASTNTENTKSLSDSRSQEIALTAHLVEKKAGHAKPQGFLGQLIGFPRDQSIDLIFDGKVHLLPESVQFQILKLSQSINGIGLTIQGEAQLEKDLTQARVQELSIDTNGDTHLLTAEWHKKDDHQVVAGSVSLNRFPLAIAKAWVPSLNNGTITSQSQFSTAIPKQIATGNGPLDIQPLLSSIITPSLEIHSSTSVHLELSKEQLGGTEPLPVQSRFDFFIQRQQVEIENLAVKIQEKDANIAFTGKGNIDVAKALTDLTFNISAIDQASLTELLARIGQPLPRGLNVGLKNTRLTLSGPYTNNLDDVAITLKTAAKGDYQDKPLALELNAQGNTKNIQLHAVHLQLEEAIMTASGRLDLTGTTNNITASVKHLSLPLLEHFGLTIPANLEGVITAQADVSGQLTAPQITTKVDGALSYPLLMLDGNLHPHPMQLALQANWEENKVAVDLLSLTLSDDPNAKPLLMLNGFANLTSTLPEMQWSVTADQLPAALIAPYGWPDEKGMLSVQLEANAPKADTFDFAWLAALDFKGKGHYTTQIRQQENRFKNSRTQVKQIDWQFVFTNTNESDKNSAGNWKLESSISRSLLNATQNREKIPESTHATKSEHTDWINLSVNTQSLFDSLTQGGQLPKIELDAQLDLGSIEFLLERDHRLEGLFKADLELEGRRNSPSISGTITVDNGLYENSTLGIYLEDILLNANANGQQLNLTQLKLEDQHNGQITAQGEVDWLAPFAEEAVTLAIEAKNMNIIDRKDIEGQVNGNLNLTGNFESMLLKGKLNISPLNVSIAGNPGPNIPQIEYSFAKENIEQQASPSAFPKLHVDLSITTDQQAFIRGRGLEAELAGNIELEGPTNNIQYQGAFNTVRGHFDVFGKRFKLERGEVGFSNSVATLFVSGVYKKKDTEIRAEISALGDKYTIELTSIPSLPEEEILALIIFGKRQQQVSAIQAVQLASAVKTLQGGGGFDPIGSTRDLLGVDTLTIDSEDANDDTPGGGKGIKVGAGKYLTEDVYLEVERSSNPTSPWQANLLIELTPSISLQSTTGGPNGEAAELLWKRDY